MLKLIVSFSQRCHLGRFFIDFRCKYRGFKTSLVLKLLFMMLLEIEAESFHQTPENCGKNVKLEGDTGPFTNPGGYKGIEVTFHDFDLEWSKTCKPYDYVRVTDKCNGSSTWSENLEDEEDGYCGNKEMFKIVSFCEDKTANCSEMKEATQFETIRLLCNVYAYPEAEVEWYVRGLNKSEADQPIDTHQNRMQNFRNGTLVIHNFRRNDTGWFRCFASNTVENDSAMVYLRVKEFSKPGDRLHLAPPREQEMSSAKIPFITLLCFRPLYCPQKPMIWNEEKDELLCREIFAVDVFSGTKRNTVARGAKWEKVAENLNKQQDVFFKVDKRAVRDRYSNLSRELRKKIKNEEKASGIETEMTNLENALEDLIEREDAAESENRAVDDQKKQDRENAADMRNRAMESLGQTKKRKESDDIENEGRKLKKRSNGNATVAYLREKS
ncbi:hypothetical protein P5673_026359 [Acropora cervicornis]|uniref:Ig-like domain-containing protein n=1 Tax=Acropora cervicornis TaxID=6130 RepID=A0AAD9Q0K4_ACRCE|nr:hypothetical protein P5673_026359 [Acropora cervicornis]